MGLIPGFSRLPTEYGAQALPDPASLEEIWPDGQPPDWQTLSEDYRLQVARMDRYVIWKGDRLAYVLATQAYQAQVLKHATELFGGASTGRPAELSRSCSTIPRRPSRGR